MRSMVFGSNSIFQPLGALLESSISSAGAVPVLVIDDRDRGLLAGLGAAAQHAVAAGDRRAAAEPVISSATLASAVASSAVAFTVTG